MHQSATVKVAKYSWRNCSFLTNSSATNRCRRAFSLSRYADRLDSSLVIAFMIQERTPVFSVSNCHVHAHDVPSFLNHLR